MNKEKAFIVWAKEHSYNLKKDVGCKLFVDGELTLTDLQWEKVVAVGQQD